MVKWFEYILNVLFWIITGWVITSSFSIQGQEVEILNDVKTVRTVRDERLIYQLLVCIAVSAGLFYANLFNISTLKNAAVRTKVFIISIGLLTASIFVFILIEKSFFSDLLIPKQITIGFILFYFTISSSYGLVKAWIISEQKHKDYALAAKQAELNLLRNQLQPHFLFNALNNLLSLVNQEKSSKLASSFEGLSQLLRYVIEETKSEKVVISKEIDFIKNYCDLQLLRFEENEVILNFEVKGAFNNQLIEPGLFIPFVENAFKYGTEPELVSTINIVFDVSASDSIRFCVENKLLPILSKNDSTGIGINSIQERLNIVYPNKHRLEIIRKERFIVKLKIETT